MSFSNLKFHGDDNGKAEITQLFMIVASMFFCIVVSHRNRFDSIQSMEEGKDLMANLSEFWIKMVELIIVPGIVENIPTDCTFGECFALNSCVNKKIFFFFRVASCQYHCFEIRLSCW